MAAAKNCLIIDDDPISNFVFKNIVKKVNPQIAVTEFTDPVAAVDYIKQNTGSLPDRIFIDLNMPVLTGWDVLDRLAYIEDKPEIYIYSSSMDTKDYEKSNLYSFLKGYIVKPITEDKFHEVLN
jgi:two-component SAPR family response regulator